MRTHSTSAGTSSRSWGGVRRQCRLPPGLAIDPSIQKGRDAMKRLGIVHLREGDGWFPA
jgi:hypothetical protein